MSIKLEIQQFLADVDLNGIDIVQGDKVEELENYIRICNEQANSPEGNLVEDAIYDRLREILNTVYPQSELLGLWSDDEMTDEEYHQDINKFLVQHPMLSICTKKQLDYSAISEFCDNFPYSADTPFTIFYSRKMNGHGTRVVFKDGYLISATSRGRRTAGRDLTRVFKLVLGDYMEGLAEYGLCEIRGELLLPFDNLPLAREYNPNIKTAFTGVSSMSRDSASDEEIKLLDFVAYALYSDNIQFSSMEEEYCALEEAGFVVPVNGTIEEVTLDTMLPILEDLIDEQAQDISSYEYFTDGIVVSVDDKALFRQMGVEPQGRYNLGNMALKVGYWKQDVYCGIVHHIHYSAGKNKYIPEAIITTDEGYEEDIVYGVMTASGNTVRRVPLYEPVNILLLEAFEGNPIYFRYGGESGVVPCFPDGTLLKDANINAMLSDDYDIY